MTTQPTTNRREIVSLTGEFFQKMKIIVDENKHVYLVDQYTPYMATWGQQGDEGLRSYYDYDGFDPVESDQYQPLNSHVSDDCGRRSSPETEKDASESFRRVQGML